jgi:hypothetical protein
MEEFKTKLEKLRCSPVNELTIEDVKLLSAYLSTQIRFDELTKKDKKFLGSHLSSQGINKEFTCKDCGRNYDIPVIQNVDLCLICMDEKGVHWPENPFTKVGDSIVNLIFTGIGLLIIFSWVFLFF